MKFFGHRSGVVQVRQMRHRHADKPWIESGDDQGFLVNLQLQDFVQRDTTEPTDQRLADGSVAQCFGETHRVRVIGQLQRRRLPRDISMEPAGNQRDCRYSTYHQMEIDQRMEQRPRTPQAVRFDQPDNPDERSDAMPQDPDQVNQFDEPKR